jgi:hypothetical protein
MYTDAKDVLRADARRDPRTQACGSASGSSPRRRAAHITAGGREVLNFCANNYLGLSSTPRSIEAARAALDERGFGMSSVRFICGTQDIHKELEAAISTFLGTEDTILYGSCFDANGGLFETLLGRGGRDHLRRAQPRVDHRRRPAVQGAAPPLRERRSGRPRGQLKATAGSLPHHRHRRRVLDGRQHRATSTQICDLAERYGALVMVDDSPRDRLYRRVGPRHRRAQRLHGARGSDHDDPRQGPGRRLGRLHRGNGRSSTCCATARARTCSRTPLAPPIVAGDAWRSAPAERDDDAPGSARARTRRASGRA